MNVKITRKGTSFSGDFYDQLVTFIEFYDKKKEEENQVEAHITENKR